MAKQLTLFLFFSLVAWGQPAKDPKVDPSASVKNSIKFHSSLRPLNWGRLGEVGTFPDDPYPKDGDEEATEQETPEDFPDGVPPRDGHCVGVVEFRRLAHLTRARGLPIPFKLPKDRVAYIKRAHISGNLRIERAIKKWQSQSIAWLNRELLVVGIPPARAKLYKTLLMDLKTREGAIEFNSFKNLKELVAYGKGFGAMGARLYTTGLRGAQGHAVELFVEKGKALIVDPNIGDTAVSPRLGFGTISWKGPKGGKHQYGYVVGAPWKWLPLSAVFP